MKLSVRVLGPGDIATTHGESDDEMDNDEDADLSSMVSQIHIDCIQLFFKVPQDISVCVII